MTAAASAAAVPAAEDSVLLRTEGRTAYLTLNRPRAINALDHAMCLRVAAALDAWAADPCVAAVVIAGAGERGLCAGGDIRAVRESVLNDGGREAAAFWRDEYRLNAAIARYPKPYVALMDGIVMGGGVGLSAHGSVRVVTERSRIAMPETGIGFVPDVGGTHLLAGAPGELGTHLALTGAAIGAADAVLCGLADRFVPSGRLAAFSAALADLPGLADRTDLVDLAGRAERAVADVLAGYAVAPGDDGHPAGVLAGQRDWIDHCYAAGTVEQILERLEASGVAAAKEAAETIRAKSPTSLKITLAAVRRARRLGGLEQVLEQEFRVSCHTSLLPDLPEGVRAQIIDKDRRPRWSPATLAEVSDAVVEDCFAPTRHGTLFG